MAKAHHTNSTFPFWQVLVRLRWPLIAIMVGAFILGEVLATLLVEGLVAQLIFDVVGWGILSGMTVWLSLAWANRREKRHQIDLEEALQNQQELNRKLQRANSHLALLSETNEHIAGSATLDEILDAAVVFPRRLVPTHAAALLLIDASGPIEARTAGADAEELAHLRECFGIVPRMAEAQELRLLTARTEHGDNGTAAPPGSVATCLVMPLHDGLAPVGWIELYLAQQVSIQQDELALLETIASEVTEAIISARRRSREERAIYELERAIADERARIARDIHDGLAQSLAFVRMRVDLWQDWIEGDPQRLRAELADLKQTLRGQIRELRRAIFALRPVQFDELGFVGGLRRYIVEFADQQGWETHIDLKEAPPALSLELEAICFRIVQEALTNAAKHAAATRVEVAIDQMDRGMRVIVRDNGHGFEPGSLSNEMPGHVGLRQMYERLAAIRGHLTLLSRPGAGTELRVWIPLMQEAKNGRQRHESREHHEEYLG
jgi:signal transduction histidine kinase